MPIDPNAYKDVLRRFASGVTVVTTECNGVQHGLTVSAFCSVSAEPPRVLVCLGNDTDSAPLIEQSGRFAVHILGREHARLGMRFAKMLPEVDGLFDGLHTQTVATGCPILQDCLAWLDCRLHSLHAVGDHGVFIGAVEAAGLGADGEPVLYYDRAWRVLDQDPLVP